MTDDRVMELSEASREADELLAKTRWWQRKLRRERKAIADALFLEWWDALMLMEDEEGVE